MPSVDTPAGRVRNRKDPAVPLPPRPPVGDRRSALRGLTLNIDGQSVLIGPNVEGDPEIQAAYDATETVTIIVRDVDGALQEFLADEEVLLDIGVKVTINTLVYCLQSVNVDESTGTLVTMVFEDEVSWRLKRFSRFVQYSRSRYTRAQAALKLVIEASQQPYATMQYFIPELNDRQRILPISTKASTSKGTGALTAVYKVKGQRATAPQRAVIDGILGEASGEGASKRVMIACVMCATQESTMSVNAVNGDHVGPFQQSPSWGTLQARKDPATATKAFLRAWTALYGNVSTAPQDLAIGIEGVQVSGQGSLYAQWLDEATTTVSTWSGGDKSTTAVVSIEPYEFARGSKTDGTKETSWDALARWASVVNWRRWAQQNVLFYVSDSELRAAAPALEVWGDEDWLLSPPGADWNPARATSNVTMRVLADRWSVRIGAVVYCHAGPVQGRLLVSATDGYMVDPEVTVTLTRPSTKRSEPAPQTTTSASGAVDTLLAACKKIDAQNRPYVWGGGHGVKLSAITAHEGLDCSGSVSLALWMAGMWTGDEALTSGQIAASWGKPGKGPDFTVYANDIHVWIEFDDSSTTYKRFDTVPWGSGPDGPHLRTTSRNDQASFTARHW